jgi:GT2 family glycosyltransferase
MSGTDGSLRSNAVRFPTWRTIIKVSEAHVPTEEILRQLHTEESIHVDYVEGSFFILRRSTMERLGGFSPSYFMYGEDRDLSLRAATMGVPTKLANRVSHRHDGGFSPRRQPWYVTGVLTFVRENTPRRLFLARQLLRIKFLLKLVRASAHGNREGANAARATLNVIGHQAQQ